MRAVVPAIATVFIAFAVMCPVGAEAAQVESSLPIVVSAGATQPPPESTELPNCNEVDTQSRALGASDNPQITAVKGGGRKYSYALPGESDEYITVSEPPEGFNPMTATDAELHTWGFPPRPSNEAGMSAWRELVGGYKSAKFQEGCRNTSPTARMEYTGEEHWNQPWSGYEDFNRLNQKRWHAVMGDFYAAHEAGASCGYENTNVAQWIGLGGDSSLGPARFMQAGIYTQLGHKTDPAWIEWWTAAEEMFAYWPIIRKSTGEVFQVEANHFIRMYVGYNYELEEYYVYITNDATGLTELVQGHIGHQFYNGDSAEWIDEAAGGAGSPLLNFGEITWWNAMTQNQNNEVLPAGSANLRKMITGPSPSNLTMWPRLMSIGQNFSDFYHHC